MEGKSKCKASDTFICSPCCGESRNQEKCEGCSFLREQTSGIIVKCRTTQHSRWAITRNFKQFLRRLRPPFAGYGELIRIEWRIERWLLLLIWCLTSITKLHCKQAGLFFSSIAYACYRHYEDLVLMLLKWSEHNATLYNTDKIVKNRCPIFSNHFLFC